MLSYNVSVAHIKTCYKNTIYLKQNFLNIILYWHDIKFCMHENCIDLYTLVIYNGDLLVN